MKLVTALLLSAVSATAVAGPNIALIGEYTFVGYECASGTPIVDVLNTELMNASITGTMSVGEVSMTANMVLNYKMNTDFVNYSLDVLRDQLGQAEKLPETNPDKQDIIAELKLQIVETEKQLEGAVCKMDAEFSYSLAGDLLSSKTTQSTATCEGMAIDDLETVDVQKVVIQDGVLKLINTDTGKNKDRETCPSEGDRTVVVYKKN